MVQIRMRLHQFGLFPSDIDRAIRIADLELILNRTEGELQSTIDILCEQWKSLLGKIKEIDKEIVRQAKEDELDGIYRSVPGVGPLIARVLSNELGDMSQFANERALFHFTGLTPCEYSSGGKVHRGHISRQGSARLRHMLIEAAWKAVRKDQVLREFYEQLASRAGKKRAIVAVARKLAGRIRAALRKHEQYTVGYKKAA